MDWRFKFSVRHALWATVWAALACAFFAGIPDNGSWVSERMILTVAFSVVALGALMNRTVAALIFVTTALIVVGAVGALTFFP